MKAASLDDRRGETDCVLWLFHQLRREVTEQILRTPASNPEVQLLGRGKNEIACGMANLERHTRSSVLSLQRRRNFDPPDPFDAINGRSRARGLTMRMIVSPSAVRSNPLLTSQHPAVRLGPVTSPLVLVDGHTAIVAGPASANGDATAWTVCTPRLVSLARMLWDATWAVSSPALPDGLPPLSPRQYATACLVSQGATDNQISRRLAVSARTVGSDITLIGKFLGVRGRAAMISRLLSAEF